MKLFATDILILTAIGACVVALMLLPPRSMRRIERNWGTVMFDDPVTFETADRLSRILVQINVFNGDLQTYRLTRKDETTTLSIAFQRDKYNEIFNKDKAARLRRDQLINTLEMLCYEVFPDQRMEVILVDKDLKTIDQLIAPTLFETQQVGRVKPQ